MGHATAWPYFYARKGGVIKRNTIVSSRSMTMPAC